MIGEHLSHYKLLAKLGAGGMGVVYKAQDTKLERLVAIKLLNAAAVANAERVQRFVQEAKTTSALNHPSITTIHQLGEVQGQYFITMEFVEGENLRERLRRGPCEIRQVIELGVQVAEGLAAAHSAGVVHRDLKPENLMLRADGFAKILDFGLAKLLHDPEPGPALQAAGGGDETIVQAFGSVSSASQPTLPGMVMGTVGYMAPEQVRGERIDARSDIFALGCVLYEVTTGQRPFGTGSAIEVMHSILKDSPRPVHDLRPDSPVELERILRKAMAKDPDERYQNAKDLAIDLRALRREVETGALSATYAPVSGGQPLAAPLRRRKLPLLPILAGAALLTAGLLTFVLLRNRTSAPPAAARMQITKLTSSGAADRPAISPDGKAVAYVTTENGKASIWMRQLATTSALQLVPPGDVVLGGLSFSPDGNWLHYLSMTTGALKRDLYRVATFGGTPRKLYEDVDATASFAPDGKQLVFMRHVPPYLSEIYVGDSEAAQPAKVLVGRDDAEYLTSPKWSPDGKSIAVIRRDTAHPESVKLALLPATGGKTTLIGDVPWLNVSSFCWAPDGSGLYVTGQENSQQPSAQVHFVRLRDGMVRPITNDLNTYAGIGASADGKTLVSSRSLTSTNLWWVPARGTAAENSAGARQIAASTATVEWPSPSPDGTAVAYCSDAAGNADIFIMNVDGTNAHAITSGPAFELQPAWSPDGKRIAYTVFANDSVSVWMMDADGGNTRKLVQGQCGVPCWSADSRWVYYHQGRGMTPSVWKVAAEGGTPEQVVPPWSAFPEVSRDGSSLLCWIMGDADGGIPKISIVPLAGGPARPLNIPFDPKNYAFSWTADGTGVTAHSSKGGASNLMLYPIDGSAPQALTEFPPGTSTFRWAWARDGSGLVCARGNVSEDVVLLQNF